MIQSWKNASTRKFWGGERGKAFRGLDEEFAIELLASLNVAKSLKDLSPFKERWSAQVKRRPKKPMGHDGECQMAHLFHF